jgi:hypothetical protein
MQHLLQSKRGRRAADIAVGAGLAGILLLVYLGDLLVNRAGTDANNGVTKKGSSEEPVARPLRMAVTPPKYDDMGALLRDLGEGYKFTNISMADLANVARLSEFDILFFTCSESINMPPAIHENLRSFVASGGTLYASDLRFDIVARAFPEFVDPVTNAQGVKQSVQAEVVDTGLKQTIGAVMPLSFDEDGWRPAAFRGPGVQTLLRGTIKTNAGIDIACPLLVQFPFQDGTVVFTSFHNEKQQKGVEEKLLKHLVLTTVTARTQSKVTKTMISGGFSPQSHNLLSTSKGSPTVSQVHYNKEPGRLQFVLGFEDQGATLHLSVVGPDGKKFEQEGTTTFTIDVGKAAAGEWKYTITARKVPYPNFPFTLTVGGERDAAKPQVAVNPIPGERTQGEAVEFKELAPSAPVKAKNLRLGVTPQGSDDIGVVLRKLGAGYQYTDIPIHYLAESRRLAEFDVVFVNCAGTPPLTPATRDAMRDFVAKGGTIYASDLQYPTIAHAFPERVSKKLEGFANAQMVVGDVLDAGLKEAIGPKMNINFNAGGWRPAAFDGREVSVLVAGNYRPAFGAAKHAPLLVKFPHQEGTVIFTSFHNSTQNTDTVIKVLEYLVFTAVTAKVQSTVNKTMESNGFFPKQGNLFSHSAGNPKITRSYANKKVGPLQFALGLQAQGAKMKFSIVAPGGGKYEKVISATVTVEVPAAPVGEWLYSVEAIEVPYANFPFTVTVGEKQG